MTDFPESELGRLPYVDHVPTDGRRVMIQIAYFDDATGEWHLYFKPRAGIIGRMAGGEPVYGSYFARRPNDPSRDVESPISTLIAQRLSFPGLPAILSKFEHDVHNCAAVIEQFHLIAARRDRADVARVLVATEIEYLLALVRSMYDHLHGIVREFVPLIVLGASQRRAARKKLPDSFARIALHGEELRHGDDIVSSYDLPTPLANWYVVEGPAFRLLRSLRDGVLHHGKSIPEVYQLEGYGLAVAKDRPPWNSLAIWDEVGPVNDRLVPLRLVFVAVVRQVLECADRLATAMANSAQLPMPIGAQVKTYLRSAVSYRLVQIPRLVESPWEQRDA